MPERNYYILSDLHLEFRKGFEEEFWKDFPESKDHVCICAGDLTCLGQPSHIYVPHFIRFSNRFKKVIYVPGNHEYYGRTPEEVDAELKYIETNVPKLKILRTGEAFEFEGQRFIGDTMWFPDRPEVHIHKRIINDSFQIKNLFPWCFTHSHLFINYLKANLREDDIVVTHHVPIDSDTSPIWKQSPTQCYFLNKDSERFLTNPNTVKPKAWIYGHTHDKHNYVIGNTRFICNPVGYPGENGYLAQAIEPAIYKL